MLVFCEVPDNIVHSVCPLQRSAWEQWGRRDCAAELDMVLVQRASQPSHRVVPFIFKLTRTSSD